MFVSPYFVFFRNITNNLIAAANNVLPMHIYNMNCHYAEIRDAKRKLKHHIIAQQNKNSKRQKKRRRRIIKGPGINMDNIKQLIRPHC
jgi:signal recognition particle GTPase